MMTNWTNYSRRNGLTLLEVLAAVAILGTILVGVVIAKSRHTRQLAATERLDAAVRAADELIAAWWASPRGIPIDDSGELGTDGSLVWRTRTVANKEIESLGARVVRVEVRSRAIVAFDTPVVAVEVVLPDPKHHPRSTATTQQVVSPGRKP
jgi:prepilin-type N-terminal cleavage/methylation domain-containing protein